MSGSGSGGSFGSGGMVDRLYDCTKISYETHIHSPNPDEILKLDVGSILGITLNTIEGTEVIVLQYQGVVIGGLIDQGNKIKHCLNQGYQFSAQVREIKGVAVKIFIQSQGK